jgi:hypothetical protein
MTEQMRFIPVTKRVQMRPVLRQRQYRVVVQEIDHGVYIDRLEYKTEASDPWTALAAATLIMAEEEGEKDV